MKVAIFLTVALISFTIFTLGVASLPVTSFPYKSSASYVYPISYNPGLWKPFSITGFQILEFQGAGPTITTFTLDLTDSNGDGKANINENVNLLCSATDSNGLNFILITVNRPDGGLTDYGSGGAAGGATDWTIPSTTVNLVSAGTYTFICTAKNVNGTSTTSTKTLEVVTASIACNPSSTSSSDGCKDSSSCQAAGGKWCMGSGYSNPYCDVQSATCTTPSMCGDGDCDKGESGTPSAPQSIMCPQDCGGSPSPSSGACSFDPRPYNTITECQRVGCNWCSSENICKAPQEQCRGASPGPTTSSSPTAISCNTIDPSGCQTESNCKGVGANWCLVSKFNQCSKSPCSQIGGCSANLLDCTQPTCAANGGNWCRLTSSQCPSGSWCSPGNGDFCVSVSCSQLTGVQGKDPPGISPIPLTTTTTQPNISTQQPGPPKITALAFTSQYPIVGETTTAHCDVTDSASVNIVKLTVTPPTGTPTEKSSNGQGTYGTSMIELTLEEGIYKLDCEASDSDQNNVTDSKTIKVTKEKPLIKTTVPTELAKTIKSEILSINGIIQALTPTEIPLTEETGFKKLTLETTQEVPANATIEIKLLDNIPKTDENNQSLTSLPNPQQPAIKILQISPDQSIQSSIKQAEIEFELTDQELLDNDLTPQEVTLARFTNNRWEELPTVYLGKQITHKFKATTLGFSVFIVTRKASTIPIPTQTTTPKPIIDKDTGREVSVRKSQLLQSLITIEQFKIRFEQLSKTTKAIAEYYLTSNEPSEYTTWLATSEGFSASVVKLDNVRIAIKSIKDEPTDQDTQTVETEIDDILKILDSSLDFLLKDVLDIGSIPQQDKLIPLAEGQSIKFQINNETHTITIKSISPDCTVQVEIASTIQNIQLETGEEQTVKISDTTPKEDTSIKLNKVEKNVAYIVIKSTFFEGIASQKKLECLKVSTSLTITDTSKTCFEITADNIVLDGSNQVLDGDGLAYAITAENRKGITIKNFVLTNYLTAIKLSGVTDSTIENNKISSITGIELSESSNNQIKNNQIQLVRSSGRAKVEEDQTPEGQEIVLNEVVLEDGPAETFLPLISITNNIDPADYKDVSGNTLTQLEFTIETTVTGQSGNNGLATISLGKGQTKLVKTGVVSTVTDKKVKLTIKITAQSGLITQEFTKEARTDR